MYWIPNFLWTSERKWTFNSMDFFNNLKSVFDSIDKDYIENLKNSMSRRLEDVIAAKGGNTKY